MTHSDWRRIHAERRRLGELLDGLGTEQWRTTSLSDDWTVEDVVAHLTAGAHTGTRAWIASIVRARFNPARHNRRLLAEHLGTTAQETLRGFHAATDTTISPSKHLAAVLGEVIVHGQDIAIPLGISLTPAPDAVMDVARFFAARDFAVNSRTLVRGLRLEATDSAFASGDGPVVHGPTLALVMAMAGRPTEDLTGDGADELARRIAALPR